MKSNYIFFWLFLSSGFVYAQTKPTDFDKKIIEQLSSYQKVYNTFTNPTASEDAKKSAFVNFKNIFDGTSTMVWDDLELNDSEVNFIKAGDYFKNINERLMFPHKMLLNLAGAKVGEIQKNYQRNSLTCEVKIKEMITYSEIVDVQDSIAVDSITLDTTFFTRKDTIEQKKIFDKSFYFMFDIENNQLISPTIYAISKVGTAPSLKPLKGDDLWWVELSKEWKTYFIQKLKMPEFPDKYDFGKLAYLTKIDLTEEKFTDFSPLEKLTGLKALYLQNTSITSLSPLEKCTELIELDISNTKVSDLSVLEKLTNLRILKINKLGLKDLASIQNLTNLIELECKENEIMDIEPLKNFANLEKLDMSLNLEITSLEPLRGLTNLTDLVFMKMKIKDLSPIAGCPNLIKLNCFNNQIESIAPIRSCNKLTVLNIGYNKIYTLDDLAGMRYLIELHLQGAPVSDISVVKNFTNIQVLDFSETFITNLSPIMNFEEIQVLKCINSKVPKEEIARFKKKYPNCRIYYY